MHDNGANNYLLLILYLIFVFRNICHSLEIFMNQGIQSEMPNLIKLNVHSGRSRGSGVLIFISE